MLESSFWSKCKLASMRIISSHLLVLDIIGVAIKLTLFQGGFTVHYIGSLVKKGGVHFSLQNITM